MTDVRTKSGYSKNTKVADFCASLSKKSTHFNVNAIKKSLNYVVQLYVVPNLHHNEALVRHLVLHGNGEGGLW